MQIILVILNPEIHFKINFYYATRQYGRESVDFFGLVKQDDIYSFALCDEF